MRRTLARDLPGRPPGSEVTIQGWVHRRRSLAAVTFLVVRDRSGLAQVVVKDPTTLQAVAAYGEETVLSVTGTAIANPSAPGGVEVVDPVIQPLTAPSATPPVELWRPTLGVGLATLLDHAGVTLRHRSRQAVWQVAAASLRGFRDTLHAQDFTEVHSPKLVGSATESGAAVFAVDYFGRPAYLAQSPQLYKQVLVGVFERVYEVGPVFRAEPHDTVRHLAEYVSLDVELGFVRDHRDVVGVLRDVLAGMVAAVREHAREAVELLALDLPEVPERLPVVHFREALEIAGAPADEPDLAPAHERAVGDWARRRHGSDLVVVEGYPTASRAFYTHPDPDDPHWSRSFDLLFRGVELVSGAQRLHRHEDYVATLTARGYDVADYASYVDAFRYGVPPHGGFAIGLERWVARLTGAANVREASLFPRDRHRLSP